MKLDERSIFLLDGIGAALSATTTGIILPQFSERVGLSVANLRLLGLIALAFGTYSLTCFLVFRRPKAPMLLTIVAANTLYCVLTTMIAFFSSELSYLGRAYFIAEVAIITGVVFLEV
ncbi:MAG: hypothetical protein K2X47_14435, partial [Bdellovibrionales bacterium]|nr:hypothetical protein [Bdellovibrionales bacterium]